MRHGEKLFETLITNEEMIFTSDMGSFYKISPDTRDLNYENYFTTGNVNYEVKVMRYHLIIVNF